MRSKGRWGFVTVVAVGCGGGGTSNYGSITVSPSHVSNGSFALDAAFWKGPPGTYGVVAIEPPPSLIGTPVGPCISYVQPTTPPLQPAVTLLSFMLNGSSSPSGLTFTLSTNNAGAAEALLRGDVLTFTGSAAGVAQLSISGTIPSIHVTSPDVTNPNLPVARSSDLAFTFTPQPKAQFVVQFNQVPPVVSTLTSLVCAFDASTGTATIPAAAMSTLVASSMYRTIYDVGIYARTTAPTGDLALELVIQDFVTSGAMIQ